MIAAMARNNVIGNKNTLPWNIPEDMAHFKKVTMGKPIIMGKRTFESIGKALPGRKNIVLTRTKDFQIKDCFTAGTIEEAISLAEGHEEVMVIGGASVYEQFLPLARRLYLTIIDQDIPGDAFFPELNYDDWKEVSRIKGKEKDNYSFIIFEKIK